MISENDLRLLNAMLEKISRLIDVYQKYGRNAINDNYILSDTVQYEFEKLYEDITRLSAEIRLSHPELHIDDLRGIRNRVAHDYESVSIEILLDTIKNDLPSLRDAITILINK